MTKVKLCMKNTKCKQCLEKCSKKYTKKNMYNKDYKVYYDCGKNAFILQTNVKKKIKRRNLKIQRNKLYTIIWI